MTIQKSGAKRSDFSSIPRGREIKTVVILVSCCYSDLCNDGKAAHSSFIATSNQIKFSSSPGSFLSLNIYDKASFFHFALNCLFGCSFSFFAIVPLDILIKG